MARRRKIKSINYSRPMLLFILCSLQIYIISVLYLIFSHRIPLTTIFSDIQSDVNIKQMKTILLWVNNRFFPLDLFSGGTDMFKASNCSYQNCYVVKNATEFPEMSHEEYDAIIFNGCPRQNLPTDAMATPLIRRPSQRYIFFQLEPPTKVPVCDILYENFFNWTVSYRFDSTIFWPFFLVKDVNNRTIGPGLNMNWINPEEMLSIDEDLAAKLRKKKKLAAWLVSNCWNVENDRVEYVHYLQQALKRYNEVVDIIGFCGNYKCPMTHMKQCEEILENDYAFYLAFENSFAVNYVTEKVLRALQHYMIPIVYGGVNYSRFLPPGSYIDALQLGPEKLAALMHKVGHDENEYFRYFKWRNHYSFVDNVNKTTAVCELCSKLNEDTETSVYTEFRKWWNHPSMNCSEINGSNDY
ncbi:hypothetical protein JYU34_010157 [Plutella xylostella]|uniref:Fucosyltransferase n=1 Tax=Plutella xylostella TaxID=51655 RepID=A0ABQ7QHX0_PLUXY|nr:hypothetical protein JYU34_010157 [Plutella xylostella]